MASDRPSRDTEGIRLGRPHPWRQGGRPDRGVGSNRCNVEWQDSRLTCKFATRESGSPPFGMCEENTPSRFGEKMTLTQSLIRANSICTSAVCAARLLAKQFQEEEGTSLWF